MKILRKGIIIIVIVLMIVILWYVDYDNLSFKNNLSDFIGLITGILIILAVILSNRNNKK